jgi:hypothetical protein
MDAWKLTDEDVIEYDEQERWLVHTQGTGASAIVGRDVEPYIGRLVEAAFMADRSTREPEHSPHCCMTRGCHNVCSHCCGTYFEAVPVCNCSDYCRSRQGLPSIEDRIAAHHAKDSGP